LQYILGSTHWGQDIVTFSADFGEWTLFLEETYRYLEEDITNSRHNYDGQKLEDGSFTHKLVLNHYNYPPPSLCESNCRARTHTPSNPLLSYNITPYLLIVMVLGEEMLRVQYISVLFVSTK